ncbi:MAG: ATPase, partial [Bacteroidota bacterium]
MLLENRETLVACHTMGFNPYFHNEDTIIVNLREKEELIQHADKVEHIFFYGAGCSAPDLVGIVRRALQSIFQRANIRVGHDLEGAALATYRGYPQIACILGTGSNSCFFDGKNLTEEVPALAYIL